MAHSFSTNNTPANGSLAVYLFISTLVAAGATKVKDSDGTTYSSGGTQITSGASGANGLANTNAWFVLRLAAVNGQQRSFCFQRSSSNTSWRVKYSYAAGFTGGSPSATQVPSATDEVTILGSGTDASPGFAGMLPTDNTYRFNVCAGDSTIGYGFYWLVFTIANQYAGQVAFMLDVMATGTFSSADVDPAIVYMDTTTGATLFGVLKLPYQMGGPAQGRCYYGLAAVATWTSVICLFYAEAWQPGTYTVAGYSEQAGNNTLGTNGWNSKDDVVPVAYGRPKNLTPYGPACASFGWKGFGTLHKYANNYRANMDTLSVDAGTKNYIYFNGSALPWDGSTPTI